MERVNPQQKIRQFGILLEHRQRLGGLGLAFAADARGIGLGVGDGLGGLPVGGGLDFLRLGFAFVLALADEHLPFGGHALEHRLRHAFRQADFFEAEKFKLMPQLFVCNCACTACSISFSIASNLQFLRVGVHKVGQADACR